MKLFLVDKSDPIAESVAMKLVKAKNGEIIIMSKEELQAYDRIRIIYIEKD